MKPSQTRNRTAQVENMKDGLQLAAESLAWLAAWVLLPFWLAFRDTGVVAFFAYVLAAGFLLALGVVTDRAAAFEGIGHLLWFTGLTSLAILLFGGSVFTLSHLMFWIVA